MAASGHSTSVDVTANAAKASNSEIQSTNDTLVYTVPSQIGGKDIHHSQTFPVTAPATGKLLHHCSSASAEDAISAVEAAQKAFPSWRNTVPPKKRDIFLKAAGIMHRRAKEFKTYMADETGCAEAWAGFNTDLASEILKDVAGRISSLIGMIPTVEVQGRSALVLKEPYGVILGVAPWCVIPIICWGRILVDGNLTAYHRNAAYILGVRSIAYAIAAGNTAVLKAPDLSPRTYWAIGDCFREAGLPDGVLNVIAHKPLDAAAVTKALIEHPSVKKINFTGSTMVGRIIAELAGKNLKPVLLELGGKAPAIVWKDADLKLAAEKCAIGAFLHGGQICMSTERIIVHKAIVQQFEEELKAAAMKMLLNGYVLINRAAVEKNKRLLRDAVSKGASLLNNSFDTQELTETRMAPVIVKGITPSMDIYQTESFGPTVSLFEVETEEEALQLANDTNYGLSSAVFTEDLRTGLRFAKAIEAGMCHINSMTVHDETALPHGGVKDSGYGRFGAIGLDEWVRTKTVTFME
jgi:acyl-CoA reductase-like NAD-dependent aldehyde dehydrogenase